MPTISVDVRITQGRGDASVSIFNHLVTYEHFFPHSDSWQPDLAPGKYSVSVAGTCPPGGAVDVDITSIQSSNPAMPFPSVTRSGPFLEVAVINV